MMDGDRTLSMPYERGEYRVVDKDQLSDLTKQGWFLVQVLLESQDFDGAWRCRVCEYLNYTQDCGGYSGNAVRCNQSRPKAAVAAVHRFLVRQGVDEAALAAETKLRETQKSLTDALADGSLLRKQVEDYKKRNLYLEESYHSACKQIREAQADANERALRLRTMEVDLAKARTALGDLKWKEIVGA